MSSDTSKPTQVLVHVTANKSDYDDAMNLAMDKLRAKQETFASTEVDYEITKLSHTVTLTAGHNYFVSIIAVLDMIKTV